MKTWTYSYDGLDRLLSAANASDRSSSSSFAYDDAGNMSPARDGIDLETVRTPLVEVVTAAATTAHAYAPGGDASGQW